MLEINQKAPQFKAKAIINGQEKEISLEDYKGKKLVIYFYPKDMTPGCTTQACNLKDNYSILKDKGIEILGISIDSLKSHQNFIDKKELPFPLISDENKEIVNLYKVWGEKSMYGRKYMGTFRTTFLINEEQIIEHIITKPKVKEHSEEIIKIWNL